jgi:hypothetical protein
LPVFSCMWLRIAAFKYVFKRGKKKEGPGK